MTATWAAPRAPVAPKVFRHVQILALQARVSFSCSSSMTTWLGRRGILQQPPVTPLLLLGLLLLCVTRTAAKAQARRAACRGLRPTEPLWRNALLTGCEKTAALSLDRNALCSLLLCCAIIRLVHATSNSSLRRSLFESAD